MTISRKLFELWQACRSMTPRLDIFDDTDAGRIQALPEYARVADALEPRTDNPHVAIILTLRTLSIQLHDLSDQIADTELAVTLPARASSSARPTLFVVREMIESARREIVLAGYRITNADIIEMLWQASRRGVRLLLICGRADGDAASIRSAWPRGVPLPQLFQDVAMADGEKSLMHVKCLLIDSHQLLVSSANFTYGGMDRNIEFGIRTTGKPAIEAKTVLMQLVRSQLFEAVPLEGKSR